jgi:sugar/nucleoside kinase (ribokinase family)
MTLFQILPVLAVAAAALFILTRPGAADGPSARGAWRWPALISAAFLVFTLYQLAIDGLVMFWINHTANATGNQVWFDLLLSMSMAFALLVPQARRLNMALLPWAVVVICTASIGLFAMWARVLFLQERAA